MNLKRIQDKGNPLLEDIFVRDYIYRTSKNLLTGIRLASLAGRESAVKDVKKYGNGDIIDEGVSLVLPKYKQLCWRIEELLPEESRASIINRFIGKSGLVGDIFKTIYNELDGQRSIKQTIYDLRNKKPSDEVVETEIACAIILMFSDEILKDYDNNIKSLNSVSNIEKRLRDNVDWYEEPTKEDRERALSLLGKFETSNEDYRRHALSNLSRIKDPVKKRSRSTAFAIYSVEYINKYGLDGDHYLVDYLKGV